MGSHALGNTRACSVRCRPRGQPRLLAGRRNCRRLLTPTPVRACGNQPPSAPLSSFLFNLLAWLIQQPPLHLFLTSSSAQKWSVLRYSPRHTYFLSCFPAAAIPTLLSRQPDHSVPHPPPAAQSARHQPSPRLREPDRVEAMTAVNGGVRGRRGVGVWMRVCVVTVRRAHLPPLSVAWAPGCLSTLPPLPPSFSALPVDRGDCRGGGLCRRATGWWLPRSGGCPQWSTRSRRESAGRARRAGTIGVAQISRWMSGRRPRCRRPRWRSGGGSVDSSEWVGAEAGGGNRSGQDSGSDPTATSGRLATTAALEEPRPSR